METNRLKIKEICHKCGLSECECSSLGKQMVGINFNPSNLDEVDAAKLTIAKAIDQMNNLCMNSTSDLQIRFADTAITHLMDAQMNMVKALTWKDAEKEK